jgi:hypothetical protein
LVQQVLFVFTSYSWLNHILYDDTPFTNHSSINYICIYRFDHGSFPSQIYNSFPWRENSQGEADNGAFLLWHTFKHFAWCLLLNRRDRIFLSLTLSSLSRCTEHRSRKGYVHPQIPLFCLFCLRSLRIGRLSPCLLSTYLFQVNYASEMLSFLFSNFFVILLQFKKHTHLLYSWTIFCIFSFVGNWCNYIEFWLQYKILLCLHIVTFTTQNCMFSAISFICKTSNTHLDHYLRKCKTFQKHTVTLRPSWLLTYWRPLIILYPKEHSNRQLQQRPNK